MATTKEVLVLARYAHKTNGKLNGTVSYLVRSSNGKDTYCMTLIEGKASGCSCPSRKPCYHMKGLENKESARPFAARQLPTWVVELVNTGKIAVPGKKVSPLRAWVDGKISTQELAKKAMPVASSQKEGWTVTAPLTTNKGFSLLK